MAENMNERWALKALVRFFDPHRQLVIPNCFAVGGWEMDLAVVTRASYLYEVEVKLSMPDWAGDRKKEKWTNPAFPLVSRFYYAVKPEMVAKEPKHIPKTAGIISLEQFPRVVRQAKRTAAPKLTDAHRISILERTYHRYWNLQADKWR